MIFNAQTAAAGLMLATLLGASAGTALAQTPAPVETPTASPDVHRFRIGTLEAMSLRDGGLTAPNDNTILGVGRTPEDVAAVLTANGLVGQTVSLSIQPLLVRDGDRLVLLDAGAGNSFGPNGGKLPASLAAAGVEPDQITDVLISHGHGDHIVGLTDPSGSLTFPNARIRIAASEWEAIKADSQLSALVAAITPKVETFERGATLSPSITAFAIDGHTAGHTGYMIRSGQDRVLYIGDTMHHSVVSVQRPDWRIAFDGDVAVATASRKAVLERAAADDLLVYAVHFPFPGVGRIRKAGETFVWVPAL